MVVVLEGWLSDYLQKTWVPFPAPTSGSSQVFITTGYQYMQHILTKSHIHKKNNNKNKP